MSITKHEAQRVWDDLRTSLIVTEERIRQIVAQRLWEPLGYSSLTECWNDQLVGVSLADDVRSFLIYVMLDEGSPAAEIASLFSGVGEKTMTGIKEAHDLGIPSAFALEHAKAMEWKKSSAASGGVIVEEHSRSAPGPHSSLRIDVGAQVISWWTELAGEKQIDLTEAAKSVLLENLDDYISGL